MQPPHSLQTSERISKGVPILLFVPRPRNPMAPDIICSLHIRTHNPQRMQSSCSCLNRCCRTLYWEARSWIVLDWGQEARRSSIIILRAFITRSEAVRTFRHSSTGYVQDEPSLASGPSPISTTQSLHAPRDERPSTWHSVGIGKP